MAWYWWLVIGIATALAAVVLVLIGLVGPKWLKNLALQLVQRAETVVGSGEGAVKYALVLNSIQTLTHGWIPASILKIVIEWAVKELKAWYQEDDASVAKRVADVKEAVDKKES